MCTQYILTLCWDYLSILCDIKSMLCFPQFSALYPEMVDAVVLLDSYGFLPTDQVLQQFLHPRLQLLRGCYLLHQAAEQFHKSSHMLRICSLDFSPFATFYYRSNHLLFKPCFKIGPRKLAFYFTFNIELSAQLPVTEMSLGKPK